MLSYNAMGTCVLVLTLLTMLVIVLVARQNRSKKDVGIWFISALIGILLGLGGAAAFLQFAGYDLVVNNYGDAEAASSASATPSSGAGMGGGGMGAGGMGGGGMGMGGGGMGGGGMGMGGGSPPPKRQLTSLVRKIDLLTGDISLNLTGEQRTALAGILRDIDAQATMTDEEATAHYEKIMALLSADQKAKPEGIGLPPRAPTSSPGGPPPTPDPNVNPFREEPNDPALKTLVERLGGQAAPTSEPAAAVPAAPAEEPAKPAP
jgi:hypothetical protein